MGRLYNRADLISQRALWKRQRKRVVFTNGVYDLLHPGQVRLLEQARSLGDVLILALNSDSGVRRLKGPTRPVTPEAERAELALALDAVDSASPAARTAREESGIHVAAPAAASTASLRHYPHSLPIPLLQNAATRLLSTASTWQTDCSLVHLRIV